MKILRYILIVLNSLRTALWLLGVMVLLMLAGALIMPGRQEFQALHSVPLFDWLGEADGKLTWWLRGLVALCFLLSVNTFLCSIESIIKKRGFTSWLLLISPQIIHIGFLFMLLAHFFSASGASQGMTAVGEGALISLSDYRTTVRVKDISVSLDYKGYIKDWKVVLDYLSDGEFLRQDVIEPNSPSLIRGFNINVKDLRLTPSRAVLLQVNREPGAVWALTGSVLFTAGIITLVLLRIRMEK